MANAAKCIYVSHDECEFQKCELHLCHFSDLLHFNVQAEIKEAIFFNQVVKWLFVMGRNKAKHQYNLPKLQ